MAEEKKKAQYAKPASQVDLEARQEKGNASDRVLSTADVREDEEQVESKEGYVGVDPIYQTAANATEAPGASKDGAEAKVFEAFTGDEQTGLEPHADGDDSEDDGEGESESSTSSSTRSTSTRKTASSSSS